MTRKAGKLNLNRDTLRALDAHDLRRVWGGGADDGNHCGQHAVPCGTVGSRNVICTTGLYENGTLGRAPGLKVRAGNTHVTCPDIKSVEVC